MKNRNDTLSMLIVATVAGIMLFFVAAYTKEARSAMPMFFHEYVKKQVPKHSPGTYKRIVREEGARHGYANLKTAFSHDHSKVVKLIKLGSGKVAVLFGWGAALDHENEDQIRSDVRDALEEGMKDE